MGQKQSYELPREATNETARKASLDHCIGDAKKIRSLSQEERTEITVGTTVVKPETHVTEIRVELTSQEEGDKKKEIVLHALHRTQPLEELDLPTEMRPSKSNMY
uniref:Uncharacterized protein n=1 Tax=Steinernema glaseri TaxID=37863 RepID=A0A1I7YKD8_9BILA